MPRDTFGWVSPRSRTALLAAGWIVLAIALGAVAYGVIAGRVIWLVAGLIAGSMAWWLSASLPEPDPAPHPAERKRREAVQRFSDHPVYVHASDSSS